MLNLITPEIQINIENIENSPESSALDLKLIDEIKNILAVSSITDVSLEAVTSQIQCVFKERWLAVVDKPNDYTCSADEKNSNWINLARNLSKLFNKTYLQILIPTLINNTDLLSSRKLDSCEDLSNFLLLDDGKGLAMLDSINDVWKKKRYICVAEKNGSGDLVERPLSLIEIARIERKTHLPEEKACVAFAKELRQSIVRGWRVQGTIPRSIFVALQEILDYYLKTYYESESVQSGTTDPRFVELKGKLIQSLKLCRFTDVYHLYGSVLEVEQTPENVKILMVDLLTKWLVNEDHTDVKREIEAVAGFLCSYNPSCIFESESYRPFYMKYSIGSGFSLLTFADCLMELIKVSKSTIKLQLTELIRQTKDNSLPIDFFVQKLQSIYALRWQEMMLDKMVDYTRKQDGDNEWWIRTAQLLCGAKLIPENYYRFLMPTIIHDENAYTLEPLVHFPLNYFILSEDGTYLIFLENSVKHYHQKKVFFNCSVNPPIKFTPLEEARLPFANARFKKYIQYLHVNQPSIKIETVDIIKKLVDGSLDERGLDPLIRPDEDQVTAAACAYVDFYLALDSLDVAEKNNLFAQRISYRGSNYTVEDLLNKVNRGNLDGCVSSCGKFFAKLVMDYAPWKKFSNKIENSHLIGVDLMRRDSAKKVFSDYENIREDEAVNRNNILMISLMTYFFNDRNSSKINFLGYSNRANQEVHAIFNLLKEYIEGVNHRTEARHVYVSVVEGIIYPIIIQDLDKMFTEETHMWFRKIIDGTLFTENVIYYDPKKMFVGLCQFEKFHRYASIVSPFLEELITIDMSRCNESIKIVRAHLAFFKLLNKCDSDQKRRLLESVRTVKCDKLISRYYDAYFNWRVRQLSPKFNSIYDMFSFFIMPKPQEEVGYHHMCLLNAKPTDWTKYNSLADVMQLIAKLISEQTLAVRDSELSLVNSELLSMQSFQSQFS